MTEMTPERWQRLKTIFEAALQQPPENRQAFIELACSNEPSLRATVDAMLENYDMAKARDFLGSSSERDALPDQATPSKHHASTIETDATDGSCTIPDSVTRKLECRRDRFQIIRPHAEGGLGHVYIATDLDFGREVALKQIRAEHADEPSSRSRFIREAEITGCLEHPGIVPIYGIGQDDANRPFYAMRLIKGISLKNEIETFHKRFTVSDRSDLTRLVFRRLLDRFLDVCHAVHYAHSRGVVHRDIKPENIMVGPFGETLLVDWGLAKSVGRPEPEPLDTEGTLRAQSETGEYQTKFGLPFGTPAYMSPEQASGWIDAIGPPTDIYSLGAVLYCMLTGHPPIQGDHPKKMIDKVRRGDWPSPHDVNPRIPRPINAICCKAMHLSPADRYPSADALAQDIEHYLADEPISVCQDTLGERLSRWQRKYPGLWTGISVTTLVLLISVIGLSWLAANLNTAKHLADSEAKRASDAERATKKESAKSQAINIARLAERGDWQTVLAELDSPLLKDYDDPVQLGLWRIDALAALNRSKEASVLVHSLAACDELGSHLGEVQLLQAESLWLEGDARAESLYRKAITNDLTAADIAYAKSYLVETVPEAVETLRDAVSASPFHRRANLMLVANLIISGQLDEAKARASSARYLFPDDPNFSFSLAIIATIEGNQEAIEHHLTEIAVLVNDKYAEQSREVCQMLDRALKSVEGGDLTVQKLIFDLPPLISKAQGMFLSNKSDVPVKVFAPPQLKRMIFKLFTALKEWGTSKFIPSHRQKAIDAIAETSKILPVDALLVLQGVILYEFEHYAEASKILMQATHAPGFLPKVRHRAFLLGIMIKFSIAQQCLDNEELNQAREDLIAGIHEYLDQGDPETEYLISSC